jgi:hypothetical protein
VIPIIVAFHRIAYIAETYSLILAISELNMEVLCKYYPLALAVKPSLSVCQLVFSPSL